MYTCIVQMYVVKNSSHTAEKRRHFSSVIHTILFHCSTIKNFCDILYMCSIKATEERKNIHCTCTCYLQLYTLYLVVDIIGSEATLSSPGLHWMEGTVMPLLVEDDFNVI